ncbi:hypothetical protein [Archangium lipolyticum]|uniref:hypothetical protein n=1 Tax=Archangium lipolyticum TaxID=2970465 RepID=UPI00214A16E6|nr:hypothetical protein [Archangium lipolyticum]
MHAIFRRKSLVLLLGLALGVVPTSPAQAAKKTAERPVKKSGTRSEKDFKRYIMAAVRLYESLEYERALAQLGRARRLVDSVKEDVLVSLYEGAIQADLGRMNEALASFKTALLLDPDAKLPLRVSPKVEQEFETLRTRVRKELSRLEGQMEDSTPEGSEPATPPAEPRVDAAPPTPHTDRPEQEPAKSAALVPEPPSPALTPGVEGRQLRVPKVSLALAGAGVVAGGLGTYFGLSSRSQLTAARQSFYADEATARRSSAQGNALAANILLGTAGVAAAGALVTWLLLPDDTTTIVSK